MALPTKYTWIGGTAAVAQLDTFTLTNPGGGSETWTFTATDEDGDTTSTITYDTSDGTVSIRTTGFSWTASTGTTTEWFLRATSTSTDPGISSPSYVLENDTQMTSATVGSLGTSGKWGYGDNDGLGYSTIYVIIASSADPDIMATNYIEYFNTSDAAAGIANAWNNSLLGEATKRTATASGATFTLQADTAGVPFNVTLAADGVGTVTKVNTTSGKGPNDWDTPENWAEGIVPTTGHDLVITGANAITYGLDKSGVTYNSFTTAPGCTAAIGTAAAYLKIGLGNGDVLDLGGTGVTYLNFGAAQITPIVRNTAAAATGSYGLFLTGTALTGLDLRKGSVQLVGSTIATNSKIIQTFISDESSDTTLSIPAGNTLTDPVTLYKTGGNANISVAIAKITNDSGTIETFGSGATSTVTINGGTAYLDSTGTVTTLTMEGGTTSLKRNLAARTVTTAKLNPGATFIRDPSVHTLTNGLESDRQTTLTASE